MGCIICRYDVDFVDFESVKMSDVSESDLRDEISEVVWDWAVALVVSNGGS